MTQLRLNFFFRRWGWWFIDLSDPGTMFIYLTVVNALEAGTGVLKFKRDITVDDIIQKITLVFSL